MTIATPSIPRHTARRSVMINNSLPSRVSIMMLYNYSRRVMDMLYYSHWRMIHRWFLNHNYLLMNYLRLRNYIIKDLESKYTSKNLTDNAPFFITSLTLIRSHC
jgi:hypothetical protein